MLDLVNLGAVRILRCAALIAAASGCTINIVPPGSSPSPPPPPAPAQSTTVNAPAVVEQHEPVRNTHDCGELQNSGMDFTEVVGHWYGLGAPSDMDDDADGIPCETVYGEKNAPAAGPTGTHDCATLLSQGMTFAEVTGYWYSLGAPSDMDDDSDGIPCETVYGEL